MYCKQCGQEIIDQGKFCKKCGAKVEMVSDQASTGPISSEEKEKNFVEYQKEEKRKRNRKIAIFTSSIIALPFCLILLACLGTWMNAEYLSTIFIEMGVTVILGGILVKMSFMIIEGHKDEKKLKKIMMILYCLLIGIFFGLMIMTLFLVCMNEPSVSLISIMSILTIILGGILVKLISYIKAVGKDMKE